MHKKIIEYNKNYPSLIKIICFGNTNFRVKVKRDYVMFSLVFQIGPQTAISMERARGELDIDMAVCGPI